MSQNHSRTILMMILSVTFLCTGWTVGSSLAYKRGFAEAERQVTLTSLNQSEIPENIKQLVSVAGQARGELLIHYKGQLERDFVTLIAAHQKGAGYLCDAYKKLGHEKTLISLCDTLVIPTVIETRTTAEEYLEETGMK